MTIKSKITLFTSTFLVLLLVLFQVVNFFGIEHIAGGQHQRLSDQLLSDNKQRLKDLVDIAYSSIDRHYNSFSDTKYLSEMYAPKLNNIVDAGDGIIQRYQRLVAANRISLKLAKERSMDQIKSLRFDKGKSYIWINDLAKPFPKMLMHPINPELNGQILNDPQFNNASPDKRNSFVAMAKVLGERGEGYVDHLWPIKDESGAIQNARKLSYVRAYQKWGWVLGTGLYVNDVKADMESRIKETIKDMRYAGGTGYFWISDDSLPYAKMIMHPINPELDGEVLNGSEHDGVISTLGGQGKQNLFNAFTLLTKDGQNQAFVEHTVASTATDGLIVDEKMLSYVRMHKQTGWIVGSSINVNVMAQSIPGRSALQARELLMINIVMTLVAGILALIISNIFSRRVTKPIEALAANADQISRGNSLAKQVVCVGRKDEVGVLASAVERLRVSTHIMLKREQGK